MEALIGQETTRKFLTRSNLCKVSCHHKFLSNIAVVSETLARKKVYSPSSSISYTNHLIKVLCREGKIVEAKKLFDDMPKRDVVSWTLLMDGFLKCGLVKEATSLFNREDAVKDVVSWTVLIDGYLRLNQIREAEYLFEVMPLRNVVTWNTMVQGYIRIGEIEKALALFKAMPERNVVSYNVILFGLMESGQVDEARSMFNTMRERNVISWTTMVNGLAKDGHLDEARKLFNVMPIRNTVSWNAMINGYAKNRRLAEAFTLFETAPERSTATWNAMIAGFVHDGNIGRARRLFDEMPERNVVSWTTMINGYTQNGKSEEALKTFAKLIAEEDNTPNEGSIVGVLAACSHIAAHTEGRQIHQFTIKTGHHEGVIVISSIIDMYSKCGHLTNAREMFDSVDTKHKDVVSWNCMIAAYTHHGYACEAVKLFEDMKSKGVKPNGVTYLGLLSACSHSGMVEKGLKYFEEIRQDDSIQIREEHISCIVDLCGRAGKLYEINEFLKGMGKTLTLAWESFLACCNLNGNVSLGKETALKLENQNAAMLTLMCNMYASAGKWEEAAEVRLKMKSGNLKQQPGCSWIEIDNRCYVFVIQDDSLHLVDFLLRELHSQMKHNSFCPWQS